MPRLQIIVVAAALLLAGGGAWLLAAPEHGPEEEATPPPAPATVSEHPVAIPEEPRTVAVSMSMPLPSAHQRRLSAMLEEGAMPDGPATATVLTDTECVPDEQMVSRCRNEMMLEDGSTIVLRHPHVMADVPCLAPGEQVRLLPLS